MGNRRRWLDGTHWLSGHEFEQLWGMVRDPGSLVCCSLAKSTESDGTQQCRQ